MKFSISAHAFKRALDRCNQIAPSSSSIAEETTGVLIRAESEVVVFMASGDAMSIRVEAPADVQEVGEALVKCGAVSSSISATFEDKGFDGSENFVFVGTTGKETLRVTGSTKVAEGKPLSHVRNFPLLNLDFFAETPEFDNKKATHFPALAFMDGLNFVSYAASKDRNKLQFNCICLTLEDNEVIFAATDATQIAEYRKAAKVNGLRGSFVLGLKFSEVAAKSINPNLEFVDLYIDKGQVFLKNGDFTLVGALVNTKFPEYVPLLKETVYKKAVFNTPSFLSVLTSIQPSVDVKNHRVALEAKKSGTAKLSTSSTTGDAESSDLEVSTPEDFNIHFDSVLLQNAVRNLTGSQFGSQFSFFFDKNAKGVLLKSDKNVGFKSFVCALKKVE